MSKEDKFRTFSVKPKQKTESEKPPPSDELTDQKPKKKKDKSAQKEEFYAPMAVLVISVLLAFGFGRFVHNWVDRTVRAALAPITAPTTTTTAPAATTPDDENGDENDAKDGPTKFWTITPNSTGLKVDAEIYKEFLGSEISMLEEEPPSSSGGSCVYIFLEVTPKTPNADMHSAWAIAENNNCRIMVMANTDQFVVDVFEVPNLELILCKTRQCVDWVQQKQQDRETKIPILYTGFTSRPPPLPEDWEATEERFQRYLHVAGQSPHKGTWNILQAWIQNPQWPPLTITSYKNQMMDTVLQQMFQQLNLQQLPPNMKHINEKLPREELDRLMYDHGVHLCLSGMEGFGHYLNEARAVGALTLATNYPAMNELIIEDDGGILLQPTNMLEWTNGLSFANVGAPELVKVMNEVVLPMPPEEKQTRGNKAKEAFDRDRELFDQRMRKFQCYLEACSDRTTRVNCAKDECDLVLE